MSVSRPGAAGATGVGAHPGAAGTAYDPEAVARNSDSSESDEEKKQ